MFALSQGALNNFAEVAIQEKKRLGIEQLQLVLKPEGRFSVQVLIDIKEIKLSDVAMRMLKTALSGTQTLTSEGRLTTVSGKAECVLEGASFNGIRIPTWLASLVISYLARNQSPYIDPTESFDLPYGIQEVSVSRDQLLIIR